ncbi:MAG: sugar transferase [Muribaculaceae bacterium]|nr:sugar transferase [Muribaculaceae bacterium]
MVSERRQRLKYILWDYVSSNLAWFWFNCIRYELGAVQGGFSSLPAFLNSKMILLGQVLFPLMMMVIYCLSGYYTNVFRKSRLQELLTTITTSAICTLAIMFVALINDMFLTRKENYEMILLLWALLFFVVYAGRFLITNITTQKIRKGKLSFNTIVVGRGSAAISFVQRLEKMDENQGYKVIGYVSIPGENDVKDIDRSSFSPDELETVCREHDVKEIIVVPTKQDSVQLLNAINHLFPLNLPIKITPDRYNLLLSRVRINNMYGDLLVDISGSSLSDSGKLIKRLMDVVISAIVLTLFFPFGLIVALMIKRDSKGSVFYSQERLGYHNRPFMIHKFRTMVSDAEGDGRPRLSSNDDDRITKIGHWLRKYRIDEVPQFWNVLKGDMSIVGPRPERKYYVKQILEREPAYSLVHQVRPGITSMGMVKYGYAKDVDEMLERLRFDLIYLENMSIVNDIKIMIFTFKTIATGKGI